MIRVAWAPFYACPLDYATAASTIKGF